MLLTLSVGPSAPAVERITVPTSEENKIHSKTQAFDPSKNLCFRVLRFLVLFVHLYKGAKTRPTTNATHPKAQILRAVGLLRFRGVALLDVFLAPAKQIKRSHPCYGLCLANMATFFLQILGANSFIQIAPGGWYASEHEP